MSDKHHHQTLAALSRTLVRLYLENPNPTAEEVAQFEEVLLHLLPKLDLDERQGLHRLMINNDAIPDAVKKALASSVSSSEITAPSTRLFTIEKTRLASGRRSPKIHRAIAKTDRKKRPSVDGLRVFLPLQIPRRAIKALEIAVQQNHINTQRSLLAEHTRISPAFADAILAEHNAFALALALKAMRLPADVARRILKDHRATVDGNRKEEAYTAFCELDPEASRQQLRQLETAFTQWRMPKEQEGSKQALQPSSQDKSRKSLEDLLRYTQTHATSVLSDIRKKA